MKYKLFEEYTEENDGHPGFYENQKDIYEWLKLADVNYDKDGHKFTINDDWSVNKNNDFTLRRNWVKYIRVKFNEVNGHFQCDYNPNYLKSLEGTPRKVDGDFDCVRIGLTSLKGAPDYVGEHFLCRWNNLITLEHAPDYVGRDFDCKYNNLVTLGHKSQIGGEFIEDGLRGTLEERIERYLNYLDTLDESDKKSSLKWLYEVDEDFHKVIVKYVAENNIDIDLPGVDLSIASDALKHKDSGLF